MARIALDRSATWRGRFQVAAVLAQLRRLRGDTPLVGIVVGVVLVSSFVFASIPRLFNQMSDDGLRYAVDGSKSFLRNIQMSRAERIEPATSGDLYANFDAEGAKFQDSLAPSIQNIIAGRSFIFDSPRYTFLDLPGQSPFPSKRFINLRQGDNIESHVTLVSGRLPQPSTEYVANPFDSSQPAAPVFELAISSDAAFDLGAKVGDQFWVGPDPADALVRRTPQRGLQDYVAEIVGIISVNDVNDPWWNGDVRLDQAVVFDDGTVVNIYATGLMAKDAYPQLLNVIAPLPVSVGWRYFTDTNQFNAGDLDQLATDVRKLDAEYPATGLAQPTETSVRTGLSAIFKNFLAQRDLTESMLSLASIGLLAVALAVIGLVAALIAERRRDQTALIRGRGGSSRQILTAQGAEGLLLAIPSAAIGLVLATLLIGDRSSPISWLVSAGIALATTLLLVLFVWPLVRRPLRSIQREDVVLARVSPRRIAFEIGVVVVALAGVYLVRRRGLSADTSAGAVSGFDPYMSAVPILLGVATGLAVLRLYPLPVRFFAWAASLRRDLVLSMGFRRVARQPSINSAPLLVLLLAVAVGVFSSVLLYSIDDGQVQTSWQTVGAPYRIDAYPGSYLFHGVDPSAVDGVRAVAPGFEKDGYSIVSQTPVFGLVSLLAVDTVALDQVNHDTPIDPQFPNSMLVEEFGPGIGTPKNPIPAIVSTNWLFDRGVREGDTFALNVTSTKQVSFVVAQIRDSFPTITPGQPFVVTSLKAMLAYSDPAPIRVNRMYIDAPDDVYDELKATTTSQSVSATVTSRAQEYSTVHDAPLIRGTRNGFLIGMLIAGAYSALAVAVALALTARSRARDLAYLRTLGLSDGQMRSLIIVEQGPPVLVALVVGIALGIATVWLIEPGIDLTVFTGPDIPVPVQVDYGSIAALAVFLIAVVGIAIAIVSRAAQRSNLGRSLRLGDE